MLRSCRQALWGLISSGCDTSTQTKISNLVETNIMTRVFQRAATSVANLINAGQTIRIRASNLNCKGGVIITGSNTINADMKAVSRITEQQVADLKNELIQELKSQLDELVKIKTDIFASPTGVDLRADFENKVITVINQEITQESIQNFTNSIINTQTTDIDVSTIASGDGQCVITATQDILVKLTAETFVVRVQDALMDNKEIAEIIDKIDRDVEVTQSGFWGAISEGFKFLKSIGTGALIGFIAVLALIAIGGVLLVILLVKLGKTPAGQDVLRQAPALLMA